MPDGQYKYIEFSYLKSISGGDKDTEHTILQMLLVDMEQLCPMLRVHFTASNWEDLEKVSHKLKSSLAFSGNEDIIKNNDKLLEIARTQIQLDQAPVLITKMENLTPLIIEELQREMKT